MTLDDRTTVLDLRKMAGPPPSQGEDPRSACFIVLTGSQAGRLFKLDADQLYIGRGADAAIQLEDEGVSRRHALITRGADGAVNLRDLGSTNGTFCNGEKVDTCVLADGDKIQIGPTTIVKFSYQDSLDEDFQRRLYESATRDALTGCHNKKYFLERLASEFAFAQRHDTPLALTLADIDHFKGVNDVHGHQAGDAVLRGVAHTIQAQLRSDDVLARYGGEEFAILMRETALDAAVVAVERIRRAVEAAELTFDGTRIPVTISNGIGVAVDRRIATADDLVRIADAHLYAAKAAGRNRTVSDDVG